MLAAKTSHLVAVSPAHQMTAGPEGRTMSDLSRRSFLSAGAALAVPALASAAAETINVACIGTGGRCRHLMKALAKVEKVCMTALCDVWDVALEEAKKLADPKAVASKNYQETLALKDIDAVLIGSPDHWHVPLTV